MEDLKKFRFPGRNIVIAIGALLIIGIWPAVFYASNHAVQILSIVVPVVLDLLLGYVLFWIFKKGKGKVFKGVWIRIIVIMVFITILGVTALIGPM